MFYSQISLKIILLLLYFCSILLLFTKKGLMKSRFILFCLFFTFIRLHAQTEYLVKINPIAGTFEKINKIDGVKWIVVLPSYFGFIENQHRYIFGGLDKWTGGTSMLYSVNASNAAIIHNPVILKDRYNRIMVDQQTEKIYGLNGNELVEVNPMNGDVRSIKKLSMGRANNHPTFDSENHYYICVSGNEIISIDVLTGEIVFKKFLNGISFDEIAELQFYDGFVYGLIYVGNKMQLVKVDISTGFMEKIIDLPIGRANTIQKYTVMDAKNHIFYFQGTNNRLYGIDVIKKEIVSSPTFPVLDDPDDNILGLYFDNKSQTLYSLHWDKRDENIGLPALNPTQDKISGCAPLTVQFNANPKNIDNVRWVAPDADGDQYSLAFNPKFTFLNAGVHYINIEGFSASGIIQEQLKVEVFPRPAASFNFKVDSSTVFLMNTSVNSDRVEWIIDDSIYIKQVDTLVQTLPPGNHSIKLIANGDCGTNFTVANVFIEAPLEPIIPFNITFYSNPTFDLFKFDIVPVKEREMKMILYDALGKQVAIEKWTSISMETYQIHLDKYAAGTYFYQLFVNDEVYEGKVVKMTISP